MRRHRLGNLLLDAVEIEARRLGGNSMNDARRHDNVLHQDEAPELVAAVIGLVVEPMARAPANAAASVDA